MSSTLWQSKYSHSNWGETGQSKERWDQSKTKIQSCKHQGWHVMQTSMSGSWSTNRIIWAPKSLHILNLSSYSAACTTHSLSGQLSSWHSAVLCMCPVVLASPISFSLHCYSDFTFTAAFRGFSGGGMDGLWYCHIFSGRCSSLESWDKTPWHSHSCPEELSLSGGEVRVRIGPQILGVFPVCSLILFPTVDFSLM